MKLISSDPRVALEVFQHFQKLAGAIQGFNYGDDYVIRDLRKLPDQQCVFRIPVNAIDAREQVERKLIEIRMGEALDHGSFVTRRLGLGKEEKTIGADIVPIVVSTNTTDNADNGAKARKPAKGNRRTKKRLVPAG